MKQTLLALALLLLGTLAGTVETGAATAAAPGPHGAGTWATSASLITGREEHTATLLNNGNVLVVGGTDGHGTALSSAEIYDPNTNRWKPAGHMATTRLDHRATLLSDGRVLITGGITSSYPSDTLASAELFDPATSRWSGASPMAQSRSRHTATLLSDGTVLVVGGLNERLVSGGLLVEKAGDAEIYDPHLNQWLVTPPMTRYRRDQSATRLRDGRVLVAGSQDNLTDNSTEIYDRSRGRWIAAAPMTSGRSGHSAVLMANGNVLVAGGVSQGENAPPIELISTEIYHAATNQWSAAASLAQIHVGATATLLDDGRVLLLGGTGRAEVYDPTTNRWLLTGPSMDRYQHTATLLRNGRVLVVGGYGETSLSTVLQFDPAGIAPVPPQPINTWLIAGALALALATFAWSIPAVRRRLRGLRPDPNAEEWITS